MSLTFPQVRLADDDRDRLSRYVEWLLKVDARSTVRLLVRGSAVGVYGATPSGVLTFVAVPVTAVEPSDESVDEVMTASSLRIALEQVVVTVRSDVIAAPALAALPPTERWLPSERALVGDVNRILETAVERQADEAESIWGGFTVDALRVAKGLGLFGHPGAQVVASTNSGWKRLVTPGGQVFVPPARTGRGVLRVVR